MFSGDGVPYCNWKENAPMQSKIHRGNKTRGSTILGTSCSTACSSEGHKDSTSHSGTIVLWGQIVESIWTQLLCVPLELLQCLLSPSLHAFPIRRAHPSSWRRFSAGAIQCLDKRRLVPLKAKASGPADGKLCSMSAIFTAAYTVHHFSVPRFPKFSLKIGGF